MISAHIWNKIYHFTLIVFLLYLINIGNICISVALTIKYRVFEQAHHSKQVVNSHFTSHGVLEMSALCTNACWKSFTPLVRTRVNNALVKITQDPN